MPTTLVFERVVEAIRGAVARGELAPGQRLPNLEELAAKYDVGVSSVREALRVLSATGIVSVVHGRGTFISLTPPPSRELLGRFTSREASTLLELAEARRILEPELAAMAAERAGKREVSRIRRAATRAAREQREGRDWLAADVAFHRSVVESAGNAVLMEMFAAIHALLLDARRETMRDKVVAERASTFHILVAEAIAHGDPSSARALMLAHMNDAVLTFKRVVTRDRVTRDRKESQADVETDQPATSEAEPVPEAAS